MLALRCLCRIFCSRCSQFICSRRPKRVRIRANVSEGAARRGPIAKNCWTKSTGFSGRCDESHAGDLLLLPIAIIAFWTLAYDLVLVARWPAQTITWCFLIIAFGGYFWLRDPWKKTNAIPGEAYHFHPSHTLLLVLGFAYAT